MRINIRLIETFVRVVEGGSFTAAARSLLIDPAAVSRAIQGLEQDLGVQLFTRSTRVLKLTAEGRRFYRDASEMLRSFEATVSQFQSETALHGQLKIGMGPALSRRMMSHAVRSFQHEHPDVGLFLFSINEPGEISEEGVDVLIRPRSARRRGAEHKPQQGVVMRTLMHSPIVVCASPDYIKRAGQPKTPADLSKHACLALVTLERDVQDEWLCSKAGTRQKVNIAAKLTAPGEELREAALAGCGIVRLLACNVADELRSGTLVRMLPDWDFGGLPIVAVYRKSPATLARVNAFLRHATQQFRRYGASAGA